MRLILAVSRSHLILIHLQEQTSQEFSVVNYVGRVSRFIER